MNPVHITQGLFTLKLDTKINVTTASVKKILYRNPKGEFGELIATVEGTTVLIYDFTNTTILTSGDWHFQPFVTIGGKDAAGKKVKIRFDVMLK